MNKLASFTAVAALTMGFLLGNGEVAFADDCLDGGGILII